MKKVNSVKNRGYSLIEMAIILVVLGIVVAAGVSFLKTGAKATKLRETKAGVDKLFGAIVSYARFDGFLPSALDLDNSSWKTSDSYGGEYIYIYPDKLVKRAENSFASDYLCRVKNTGMSLRICADKECSSSRVVENVAFFAGSKGEDMTSQTETDETGGVKTLRIYGPGNDDDMSEWSTLSELQSLIACSGKPMRLLNSELPPAKASDNSLSARIYAEGGIPDERGHYLWCVEADPSNPNDDVTRSLVTFAASDEKGDLIPGTEGMKPGLCHNEYDYSKGYALVIYNDLNAPEATGVPDGYVASFYINAADSEGNSVRRKFVRTVY